MAESHQKRDVVAQIERDALGKRCRLGEIEQVLEGEREGDGLLQDDADGDLGFFRVLLGLHMSMYHLKSALC